jgi:uncharacterized protein YdaU (DUF1376 family)
VNYYEHHIRDYDAATAHLTWDQDMAYSRLLRRYYRKEQPIPSDIAEACRQVRATSKPQRDAVEAVLKEFFVLREDGWHQETCDEAIAIFKAGEPEREAKKKNEDTRLARHRAERAELFGVINGAGLHMAWNIPIAELRAAAERVRTGTATPPATQTTGKPATPATPPATATATPATATQTPDTRHQTPEDKENPPKPPRKRRGTAAEQQVVSLDQIVADGVSEQHAKDWLTVRAKKGLPLTPTAWEQVKTEAKSASLSLDEAIKTAAVNSWGGFKAKWLTAGGGKSSEAANDWTRSAA